MGTNIKQWQEKKQQEFKNLDFDKEIKPLLQKCYNLAISDVDLKLSYTSMVLNNLKIITSRNPMSISFNQYKSMVMYIRNNEPIDASKLFDNSYKLN
jgi:hypothetical protein